MHTPRVPFRGDLTHAVDRESTGFLSPSWVWSSPHGIMTGNNATSLPHYQYDLIYTHVPDLIESLDSVACRQILPISPRVTSHSKISMITAIAIRQPLFLSLVSILHRVQVENSILVILGPKPMKSDETKILMFIRY